MRSVDEAEGRPCILVADDCEELRGLIVALLDHFGARAILARDGREALVVFEKHRAEIDLALLDVELPEQGGLTVSAAIRAIAPHVPCWLMTGNPYSFTTEELIEHEVEGVIHKPFKLEALRHVLASIESASTAERD